MFKKHIKINLPMDVFNYENKNYYKTLIQDVAHDYFVIGVPMLNMGTMVLYPNETAFFQFYNKSGHYCFETRVLQRFSLDGLQYYALAYPDQMKKVQRREFYRHPCLFPMDFWVLEQNINPLCFTDCSISDLGRPHRGNILDISGGGIKFSADSVTIEQNTLLGVKMYLKTNVCNKDFVAAGFVVRQIEADVPTVRKYALKFELRDMDRENLVRYVFKMSRTKVLVK